MLESRFIFISKIFFIVFFTINLPSFFPIDIKDSGYFLVLTTTIFDTASLLILSLSLSKFVHFKNLNRAKDLTIKDNEDELIGKIDLYSNQIIKDNKVSFILASFFALITFIQPIILAFTLNKSEIYSTAMINSINLEYKNQKEDIEELILKEKKKSLNDGELTNLEEKFVALSYVKDKNIERLLQTTNKNKFDNVKIFIRNILLGIIWTLCLYKIYKI